MAYLLIILVMLGSFIVQQVLQSKFRKYSEVASPGGMTGADIARKMLQANGITNFPDGWRIAVSGGEFFQELIDGILTLTGGLIFSACHFNTP